MDAKEARDVLRDIFKFAWSEYMRWYVFIAGLNLIGLGFVYGLKSSPHYWIDVAFVVFNTLGFITSGAMYRYSASTAQTWARLTADDNATALLPAGLAKWSAAANAVGLALFILVWARLAFGAHL